MKFKLDENLPREAVEVLRSAGYEVHTVADESLSGEVDSVIAARCAEEDRVLLTFDVGFSNIRAYPPAASAGLVVFRLKDQETVHLLEVLRRFLRVAEEGSPVGQLWIVEEARIRVRGSDPQTIGEPM